MWYNNFMEAFTASGMSRHTLADRSNLPYDTVKRIVSGKTLYPTIDTLDRLAGALGKTLGDLLANTRTVVGDQTAAELHEELQAVTAERDLALAELALLKEKVNNLSTERDLLNLKLMHKDELLAVHAFYNKKEN